MLRKILKKDFNKDTTAGSRLLLVQMDNGENVPPDSIGAQHMAEEASNVTQAVRLVAMNGIVILGERGLEEITPETVELCKPLSDQTIELRVGAFLRTALDDHGG